MLEKWCGYVDDPEPVTTRLRDFAEQNWKNKAFRQMTFGLYCPPMAFCEQAQVTPPPRRFLRVHVVGALFTSSTVFWLRLAHLRQVGRRKSPFVFDEGGSRALARRSLEASTGDVAGRNPTGVIQLTPPWLRVRSFAHGTYIPSENSRNGARSVEDAWIRNATT